MFGFESPVQQRNIVGVAGAYPEVARQGVLLRKFGQEVIRITAGKRVHGTGAVPGGVNKSLTPAERDELLKDADQMIQWSRDAVHLARRLHETNGSLYDEFGLFRSHIFSLVRADGALDLYDGHLRLRDARGQIVSDNLACADYDAHIREEVKSWSYMKFPYITELGPAKGWYKVGPLARVQNCDFIPSELAEIERQAFIAHGEGEPIHAPLAYHWARMIEMLHAAEVIRSLLDDPDILSDKRMTEGPHGRVKTLHGEDHEDFRYYVDNADKEQLEKYFVRNLEQTPIRFSTLDIQYEKDKPVSTVKAKFYISKIGTQTGNRFFLNANPIEKLNFYTDNVKEERKGPFYLQNHSTNKLKITYLLPPGYQMESKPIQTSAKESDFGKFEVSSAMEENKYVFTRDFVTKPGIFEGNRYKEMMDFRKEYNKLESSKAVFIKP